MAAGKHLCANRASNAICKISPLLIISTRSEYQVSVELHSVEGGEEEKKAGKCLSSALEHCPWSRWLDCHNMLDLQQGMCHILQGFCVLY